jgi:hypothetical protein
VIGPAHEAAIRATEPAFDLFERIEATGAAGPGSANALKSKALPLTGGPDSLRPPAQRSVYGELVATGQGDAFVTYRTKATLARREYPALQAGPSSRPTGSTRRDVQAGGSGEPSDQVRRPLSYRRRLRNTYGMMPPLR